MKVFKTLILTSVMSALGGNSAKALTIMPATQVIQTNTKPKSFAIRVYNDSKQKVQIIPSVRDWGYTAKGKKSIHAPGTQNHSLSPYLKVDTTPFLLESKQSRMVNVQTLVPSNKYGGHHAIVFFHAIPYISPLSPKKNRVLMAVRLGSTVFQESQKGVHIQSRIKGFDITPSPKGIDIDIEVLNQSNTFIDASAIIAVTNDKNKFMGSIKIPKLHVIRGQTAHLKKRWKRQLPPGKYQFLITYKYREKSVTVSRGVTLP